MQCETRTAYFNGNTFRSRARSVEIVIIIFVVRTRDLLTTDFMTYCSCF